MFYIPQQIKNSEFAFFSHFSYTSVICLMTTKTQEANGWGACLVYTVLSKFFLRFCLFQRERGGAE